MFKEFSLGCLVVAPLLFEKKENLAEMATHCHSFSFAVAHCHALPFVVPLVVICCHLLSFVVTRCHWMYHSFVFL